MPHSSYHIQIINRNLWHYNKTSHVTITELMGSHQLTPCRWTEMPPGHILALSWNSFSSLNKHRGKQLWPQPITINQHNYVKNVFEIWRSNRMSLCVWFMASSLSSDAEMKPCKVYIWKTSQRRYSAIWHFFGSRYAFPEKEDTEIDLLWIKIIDKMIEISSLKLHDLFPKQQYTHLISLNHNVPRKTALHSCKSGLSIYQLSIIE